MSAFSPTAAAPPRIAILLAFASVYVCWGATYTAMSIGVHLLPATILAGTRMLIGAFLMLTFCALRKKRLWYGRSVMARLGFVGVLLLFGGNIGLVWSEKYLASGLAALLVAVVPLYVAVIEMKLPAGEQLRPRGMLGLALGLVGLVALLWPSFHGALRHGTHSRPMQLIAALVVLVGALSWASGSVLFRRMRLPVDPLVAAGWEMLAAGLCNCLFATVTWQWPRATWNAQSISAIGYLVLFGSLLGFSCYIWLIHHVPVAKVATYAYVNPMVAVLLGALVLREHLQPSEFVGMAAILCAVALVTSSQMKSGRSAAEIEVGPLEREA
ncbi:MAG TPA: EamA family transporter [Terracidiphilus sp.]|nr:EamA family transporter [Terracidiphilus sp.]